MSRAPAPLLGRRSVAHAEREARVDAERAAWLASTFGPCATCKVDVGPDGIHAATCTRVPTERRADRGRL